MRRPALDVHGHLMPDDEERVRAALDDVLGSPVSSVCPETAPAGT
jgi:hypothetical protein